LFGKYEVSRLLTNEEPGMRQETLGTSSHDLLLWIQPWDSDFLVCRRKAVSVLGSLGHNYQVIRKGTCAQKIGFHRHLNGGNSELESFIFEIVS
jgi:hypothetical protein